MKKALATILALVMAIGLCSVSWAANPASVNSAEELKTAVEAGGEITLDKDIEISETISVSKPVTINLNSKTITGKSNEAGRRVFNVVAGGSLTLTGSGTITTAGNNDTTFPDNSSVIRVGDNTNGAACGLVVGKDVKIIAPASYGIAVFGKNTKQTLEVSGTVTAKEASAISGNGSAGFTATEITINDGATITSENNVAVYHPQAGTLTVKAATITGRGGIEIKSGTANVNVAGANIKATGNVDHTGNNDGTSSRGYAIAVVENPGYKGTPSAVIQNGNFVGAMGILKDGEVSADEKKGSLAISAGSFTVNVSDYVTGDTPVAATGEQEGTYVVGQSAINAVAKAGNDVRIVKGNVTLTDVPAGVTVIPNEGTTVVVNGKDISSSQYRDGYTVPQSSGYYYYQPTTDTKTTDTKGSPKTFDAGIALYVGMVLTSAAGVAFVGKKRED